MGLVTNNVGFNGGLVLTPEHFAHRGAPCAGPIVTMPVPEHLYFPLRQRNNEPYAQACVAIGEHVLEGQALTYTDDPLLPPLLASCNGTISTINTDYIVLATETVEHHPSLPYTPAEQTLEQRLYNSGIRGLGGASFPSYLKFSGQNATPKTINTLIINAAECEPLIQCDEALIMEQADAIVESIHFLIRETQCKECLIGIEDDKQEAIARLSTAMAKNHDDSCRLVVIPAKFPTGGERQLIKTLTNKEVPYQSRPNSLGIVCFNIATTLAIKNALVDRIPFSSRIVSVTGTAIGTPQNVRVTLGTSIRELIEFVNPDINSAIHVTVGGPVSGVLLAEHHYPVTASCNCLLVETKTEPQQQSEECIRCGNCDSVCPQSLLPQQLYWYAKASNYADAQRFKIDACIECGCCDLVCPSAIPLTSLFRKTKYDINSQRLATEFAQQSKERFEKREARLQDKEKQRQLRIQQRKAEIDEKKRSDPKAAVKAALARAQQRKPQSAKKSDGPAA